MARKKISRKRKSRGLHDSYLDILKNASTTGKKMAFPYEIPTINTAIDITPGAQSTIKIAAISIGAGIAISGVASAVGRIISK